MGTRKARGIAPRIDSAGHGTEPRVRHLLVALALAAVSLLAYSNSFRTGFALDNKGLILQDPRLREATRENVELILQHTYWWPSGESGLYRPLTTLSYLFNYSVLGNRDHPAGYHWINFSLHAANILLVYALALRLVRQFWPPVFVAALWAVHPVLTESVTSIVGRSDLLAAMAVLGGLLIYLKSTEATSWRRLAWLAGLLAVTTVGAFSKESAVVAVAVVALYELTWWRERKQVGGRLPGCVAILVPLLAMWYQRSIVLAGSPPPEFPFTDNPLVAADFWTGRLTAIAVMARYLWLVAWPAKLSCDYSYPQIPLAEGSVQDWIAWMVVGAAVAIVVLLFRRNRTAFFLASFAFVTFVPVSNLLVPTGTIMAERLLYLPSVGLVACLVLAIFSAGRRTGLAALAPLALCMMAAGFAARTWARNPDWHDDVALGTAAVRTASNSYKVHKLLAGALYESDPARSNIDRVIDEAEKSIALLDSLPDARNDAEMYRRAGGYYLDKGDLLWRRGQDEMRLAPPESVRAYERALPLLLRSVAIINASSLNESAPGPANVYRLLSVTYLRLSDSQKAFDAAVRARALDPLNPEMYRQLSNVLLATDRGEEAAVALMEGVMLTSDLSLREKLMTLYRGGLDEEGCAVVQGPSGAALNPSCGTVQRHLCAASAATIQVRLQTGRPDLAERMRNTALGEFRCPASR